MSDKSNRKGPESKDKGGGRTEISLYPAMLNTLEQTLEQGGNFRLWQSSEGIREYIDARLVRLNREQSRLCFIPEVKGEEQKLKKRGDIFGHCKYRGLLFRAQLLRAQNSEIEVSFPEQLQIQDARIERRESYGLCSEFFAIVGYIDESGEMLHKELKILDRSEHGLCLIVDQRIYKLVCRSKCLTIISSTNSILESGANYHLRNHSTVKGNSMSLPLYRLGFELA
ncbi:MAG: hypothetical protein HN353_05790 [Bdellovibrionales bacterium]|jgi:hypothetical protein|nr:hypothetical protein [Bdellovibrionales bacterium]MBT3525046.1 hypothetical protein [Bdellovibrionales bacterium]MBT7669387.1 hypothetical protein [Bdellovibrionales bacterium]MBT7767728.1 hypothetical protein [Bdellovibrionales bacterium]